MGDLSAEKHTVFVTGFGPFGGHVINASWEAVKELQALGVSEEVHLVTEEIPVEYAKVRQYIPQLWSEHKPKLMVHIGVSGIAKEITLEQQAHNDKYNKCDVIGRCPDKQCCVEGAQECIVSQLDMTRVQEAIQKSCPDIKACVSLDPGRYLCDFIYFTSLNVDRTCTAFIHVPPLNKPYTAKQLAQAIKVAIEAMLEQL